MGESADTLHTLQDLLFLVLVTVTRDMHGLQSHECCRTAEGI